MKNKRCEECANCLPIGEGDHICDKTNKLVIEEYIPTDDYGFCRREDDKNEID
ncbi:MAG: hypothetical protein GX671_08070 [Clostridiales bacterium]|nr:hypothetical protein [Clostridiales bacterium]